MIAPLFRFTNSARSWSRGSGGFVHGRDTGATAAAGEMR